MIILFIPIKTRVCYHMILGQIVLKFKVYKPVEIWFNLTLWLPPEIALDSNQIIHINYSYVHINKFQNELFHQPLPTILD